MNLPPIPHHSRWSQRTGVELPESYSDSCWRSISHVAVCMFQRYSLNLSHPLLPPTASTSLFSMSVSPCPQILRCIPRKRGGSVVHALYRHHGALRLPSVETSRSRAVLAHTLRNWQVLLSVLWSPEPSFKTSNYPEATILEILCQETLSSPSLFESTVLRTDK